MYWVDGEMGVCRVTGPDGYLTYAELTLEVARKIDMESSDVELRFSRTRAILPGATRATKGTLVMV